MLSNIEALSIGSTRVADIKALEELSGLELLFLNHTLVNDLTPVAHLIQKNEFRLGLSIDQVSRFRSQLMQLDGVNLQVELVGDVTPLVALKNIRSLFLGYMSMNFAPLANLPALQSLGIANKHVKDISLLARLTNLRSLYLMDTQVRDLSPLASLDSLEGLYLNDSPVSDVKPLAKLTNLQKLDLRGTRVTNVAPLADLINLQELDLRNTQVSDISPLEGLNKLKIYR